MLFYERAQLAQSTATAAEASATAMPIIFCSITQLLGVESLQFRLYT